MRSYSNKGTGLNLIFGFSMLIIAVMAVLIVANTNTGTNDVQNQNSDRTVTTGPELPVSSLAGQWEAENNGSSFVADISEKSIQIKLVNEDVSMLYWNGTFETAQSPQVSILSKKVKLNKRVLSGADEKLFTYKIDTISFEFEAMGMKRTVVLRRV